MRTHERRLGAAALLLALGLGGCDAGLTEVNRNPNAPEDVPIENVLLSGIWDVMANAGNRGMFGNWTQLYHASNWAQHLAQPVYNDEDRYTPRAGIPTNIWDEMYTSLTDLEHVKEHAAAEGLDNMWAVAEIMQVNGFMLLTDYFGDIPYFEALSLEEDIQFPAYTPQAEVYPDLIARLAAAAALIDTDAAVSFGAFDPVYQGDMQGWLEFANSLQLRLAMRLSDTSLATEAEAAFAAAWGADVFDDAGDIADADGPVRLRRDGGIELLAPHRVGPHRHPAHAQHRQVVAPARQRELEAHALLPREHGGLHLGDRRSRHS